MELEPTAGGWLDTVLRDFDSFLKDHASCEKKASGMALNIASHYPDKPELLNAMADLVKMVRQPIEGMPFDELKQHVRLLQTQAEKALANRKKFKKAKEDTENEQSNS